MLQVWRAILLFLMVVGLVLFVCFLKTEKVVKTINTYFKYLRQ